MGKGCIVPSTRFRRTTLWLRRKFRQDTAIVLRTIAGRDHMDSTSSGVRPFSTSFSKSARIFQPLENVVDFYIEGAASPVVFKAGEPQRIVRLLFSIS